MTPANPDPLPPPKTSRRKTVLVSLLRSATLYLSYHHYIVPKGGIITREMQRGLWMSIKNAYKFGRLTVRTAAGELKAHLPDTKKPAFPTEEKAGGNALPHNNAE